MVVATPPPGCQHRIQLLFACLLVTGLILFVKGLSRALMTDAYVPKVMLADERQRELYIDAKRTQGWMYVGVGGGLLVGAALTWWWFRRPRSAP